MASEAENRYYQVSDEQQHVYSLPYHPSSASHSGFLATQSDRRSPPRIPQCQKSSGDMFLVDGPSTMSSQSVPDFGVGSFNLHEFTADPNEAMVMISDTPQFGAAPFPHSSPEVPYVVPTVVRKKPSGFFRVLETFDIDRVKFNFDEMIQAVVARPNSVVSEMWSGLLTGTRFDRNYTIVIALMEKVLMSIIDETVRRLRDECQAQQLAVFVRRIWTALLPVCAEVVEKYIEEYHATSHESFFKEVSDEWDAEDETREKRLDELDAELEVLQAEISGWESLQSHFLQEDYSARLFVHNKQLFLHRLEFVENYPVDASSKFLADGNHVPQLPDWQHPETRRKAQVREALVADMHEALSTFEKFDNEKIGIPVDGFCFEAGVKTDPRWDAWNTAGWTVLLPDENVVPPQTRRLSVDAFSAFH